MKMSAKAAPSAMCQPHHGRLLGLCQRLGEVHWVTAAAQSSVGRRRGNGGCSPLHTMMVLSPSRVARAL